MRCLERVGVVVASVGLITVIAGGPAAARSLRQALVPTAVDEGVLGDAIRPLSQVIGTQIASQIPSFATSAGFTYRFNSQLEVFEREATTLGPVFAERALTIGEGRFNIQTSYSYIKFKNFNGHDLGRLRNRFEFANPAPGGEDDANPVHPGQKEFYGLAVTNAAGDFRDAEIILDLDIEAHLFDVSLTYGLLDNLDVNVDIPILRTFARSTLTGIATDPRCVALAGSDFEPDDFNCLSQFDQDGGQSVTAKDFASSRASSIGVGDIRLRGKYNPIREPVALSGLLDLVIPSGDQDNFQGTGDTRLGTLGIASKEFFHTVELHTIGGVEFVVNDVDRSQARYVVGATAQVARYAALTLDFIGRSEFARQGRIGNNGRLPAVTDGGTRFEQTYNELFVNEGTVFTGRPYFINIKRNDVLDLSVGLKVLLGQQGLLFANVLIPLNDDGIRPEVVPTVGFEYNFGLLS